MIPEPEPEPREPTGADFDGGARQSMPAERDALADHNALLADAFARHRSEGGGRW